LVKYPLQAQWSDMHAKNEFIAKISYLERSVVTLKLHQEYLYTVIYNT